MHLVKCLENLISGWASVMKLSMYLLRGEEEMGAGIGVTPNVTLLFVRKFLIAMIIIKGCSDVRDIPTVLSRCFINYCLFGSVTDEERIESFKNYVSADERVSTSSFTANRDDNEDLKDFIDIFKCRILVNKDNVYTVLCEISRQELFQKPHIMASCWKEAFSVVKDKFDDSKAAEPLYVEMEPTTKQTLIFFK